MITPIARGHYRQKVSGLATPRLILYWENTNTPIRVQGLSPSNMFSFAVPLVVGRNTRWWGEAHHETGLPVMMPGAVHTEFSAGQEHLMALIDLSLLREYLPEDLEDAIELAANKHVIPASGKTLSRLGTTLNSLLDNIQANTQVLRHTAVIDSLERELLTAFRHHIGPPPCVPKMVGKAKRQRGLQRAIDYIRSTTNALITVNELCRAANISQRTLEYAFHEAFGMSPLRFLNLHRYHKTRRDLLAADCKTSTVQDIAYANGFYQMGRFAKHYQGVFDELPSQTLMRPPVDFQEGLINW